uniref:Uncharacterized protein n=1 Tax=Anguilla anguilla TaxID=7936 RepID=A0A0E9U9V1_ANGAN
MPQLLVIHWLPSLHKLLCGTLETHVGTP